MSKAAKVKKVKVVLEFTEQEIELIRHGWKSYYYGGEQLNIGRDCSPGEDKRDGWYKEVEDTRKILNSLPRKIVEGIHQRKRKSKE